MVAPSTNIFIDIVFSLLFNRPKIDIHKIFKFKRSRTVSGSYWHTYIWSVPWFINFSIWRCIRARFQNCSILAVSFAILNQTIFFFSFWKLQKRQVSIHIYTLRVANMGLYTTSWKQLKKLRFYGRAGAVLSDADRANKRCPECSSSLEVCCIYSSPD